MTTFAVIVTSYNYRAFVCEAIDSALAQARPASRVIVVDDGSTDGTPELLRERYGHDPRVALLCGENGGQLVAFQRGVAAAEADVLCFLDADDLWKPDYLSRLGEAYDARGDVGFVFTDIELFGDEARRVGYARRPLDLGYTAVATYALCAWYGAPTSALSMRAPWAARALDLPQAALSKWKLSADNCLVYGASVLGARKLFLPTGQVRYRIHGRNGWWSNRGPAASYLNRLHSRALISHYAQVAGIDRACLDLAKLEYLTGDRDWAEARRYARVAMRSEAGPVRRLEQALAILRRGFGRGRSRR